MGISVVRGFTCWSSTALGAMKKRGSAIVLRGSRGGGTGAAGDGAIGVTTAGGSNC